MLGDSLFDSIDVVPGPLDRASQAFIYSSIGFKSKLLESLDKAAKTLAGIVPRPLWKKLYTRLIADKLIDLLRQFENRSFGATGNIVSATRRTPRGTSY